MENNQSDICINCKQLLSEIDKWTPSKSQVMDSQNFNNILVHLENYIQKVHLQPKEQI